jgi:hypothetical protein
MNSLRSLLGIKSLLLTGVAASITLSGCGGSAPDDRTATTDTVAAVAAPDVTATAISASVPSDAHIRGAWSAVSNWPIMPIHAVLLPDGRVLTYGTDASGRQTAFFNYDVWDPAQGPGAGHLTLPNGTGADTFCGAQLVLPQTSGGVLLAGGDNWTGSSTTNTGNNTSNLFDYHNNTLARGNTMNRARWYSTTTTLLNGETYIQGGRDANKIGTDRPEIRATDGTFRLLPNVNTSAWDWYYPRNWVAPDGRIFGFESFGRMWYINPAGSGAAVEVGRLAPGNRGLDASAAMFAPGKILQFGGESNGAVVIDITAGTPVVTGTQQMIQQRRYATSTLLADGSVLATGGSSQRNALVNVSSNAEIWNPVNGMWTIGTREVQPRLYHSSAMLLPDGSVLVGGGGAPGPVTNLNVEIYYPPYLFAPGGVVAQRPLISAAPTALETGKSFTVDFGNAASISRVVLIKTGSVTHGWNMEQRFIELPFRAAGGRLTVQMTSRATDATPGRYLLFILDNAGVPSIGKIVYLGIASPNPANAPSITNPGKQTTLEGTAVNLQIAASDPNGNVLTYSAAALPKGLAINPTSGRITGTATVAGSYSTVIAASDGVNTGTANLTWNVNRTTGTGTGLTGRYYNNKTLTDPVVLTRLEGIDFVWSGAPGPGVNADGFSARWTGFVQAPVTGSYRFQALSDDGIRVSVNGVLLINNWTDRSAAAINSGTIALTANTKYTITVEHYDNVGSSVARLLWLQPGNSAYVTVPLDRLYPN